jgi:hypothetical protein
LPFEKLQAEAGFDLMLQGTSYDRYPLYFHGKVATPEDALFKWQPSLAFGIYNVGTHRTDAANTMQNVGYALVARTLPYVGRLSVGYYLGNAAVLRAPVDAARPELGSKPDNHGFLASWDRTMSEISDKLWLCVDFQQGNNVLGAINAGLSWSFTRDISVLVAYDHYWNQDAANFGAGKDTFTVQLDISLFVPEEKPAPVAPAAADQPAEKAAVPPADVGPAGKKDEPPPTLPPDGTQEKPAASP